jgi:flagella basal body P-ring formation protein FlgA
MIPRIVVALWCASRIAPAQALPCEPVEGDRILGKHLAAALSEFHAIPPETPLGNMPPPGSKRTIHVAELASLAERYSIQLHSPRDVCFEWPMESLDRNRMLQAMRESLGDPDSRIEIAEASLNPVPRGRLEFPRESLGKPASPAQIDPVLWRGAVVYGDDKQYPVWARVRVTVPCERATAAEALKPGQPIDPRQVRIERTVCFPAPESAARKAPLSIQGLVPARPIAAGSEIRPEFLIPPNDVNRGDVVQVEVRCGAARLAFAAKAESGGRHGDFVALRNPSSNKVFQARVEGKDRALIESDVVADSH